MLKVVSIILLLGFMFAVDGLTNTKPKETLEEKSVTLVSAFITALSIIVTVFTFAGLFNSNKEIQVYSLVVAVYAILSEYTKCDQCHCQM